MDRRIVFLAACLVAGCGPSGITPPSTVPASGRVLYKGKAYAGIHVTLNPRFDMGRVKFTPSGVTDRDGKFTLTTAAPNDGAPPGDYTVTFAYLVTQSDRKSSGIEVEVDTFKGKYRDPGTSKFQVTVQRGKEDLGPFQLD